LTLDIETAPHLADVWTLWNNNVSLNQLRESSYVLCWAAKWRGSKKMMFGSEWTNPTEFIEEIHSLLDSADAIVGYNTDRFDIPTLNREFLKEKLGPPAPYQSIDLYKVVKRKFKFASNKLVHVCEELNIGTKVKHEGHGLWTAVQNGDAAAQKRMEKYCKGDVFPLTEGLHDYLLPWIPNYPNRLLYLDDNGNDNNGGSCVRCAEGILQKRGFYYTANGKYQTYRCGGCGGYQRDTRRVEGVSIRSQ
jgi:hypothetical protein